MLAWPRTHPHGSQKAAFRSQPARIGARIGLPATSVRPPGFQAEPVLPSVKCPPMTASFSFGNTPSDRERFALEKVLSSPDESAEVRIFGMQDFNRWRVLYDERIAGLTNLVVGFTRRSGIAAHTVRTSAAP